MGSIPTLATCDLLPDFFRASMTSQVTVINSQVFLKYFGYRAPSLLRHFHHGATNNDIPVAPSLPELKSPEHMAEARVWVEKFKAVSTLKGAGGVEMSFSRSSGPGGQVRSSLALSTVSLR